MQVKHAAKGGFHQIKKGIFMLAGKVALVTGAGRGIGREIALTLAGYGAAVIIKTLTDNVNRTAGDIRAAMSKCGGQMGATGCVSYMFDNKGVFVIERTVALDEDTMMEYCLEAEADDYVVEDDLYEVYTTPEKWSEARKYFEDKGVTFLEAEIKMLPQNYISLDADKLATFLKMLDKLEELDDVQSVYHNVELPDEE